MNLKKITKCIFVIPYPMWILLIMASYGVFIISIWENNVFGIAEPMALTFFYVLFSWIILFISELYKFNEK